jgi:hypothetical protein
MLVYYGNILKHSLFFFHFLSWIKYFETHYGKFSSFLLACSQILSRYADSRSTVRLRAGMALHIRFLTLRLNHVYLI